MSNLQAVILAGGQGSRLRPYTTVLPKPLLPVGDLPIAEIIIRQLGHYGIKNIIISTGHLAGLIETYFGDGRRWGVRIRYVQEDKPLGTAGAIKLIPKLQENFLVINGDTLTDLNFRKLFDFHQQHQGIATISVKERVVKTDFGVIEFNQHHELLNYIEKPAHKFFVSLGMNILHKRCREYIKAGESIGMPELMLRMKENGEKVYCFKAKNVWLDLGRMDDLEAAQEIFASHRKKFLLD